MEEKIKHYLEQRGYHFAARSHGQATTTTVSLSDFVALAEWVTVGKVSLVVTQSLSQEKNN